MWDKTQVNRYTLHDLHGDNARHGTQQTPGTGVRVRRLLIWVLCEYKISHNLRYEENDSICEHYVGLYCENTYGLSGLSELLWSAASFRNSPANRSPDVADGERLLQFQSFLLHPHLQPEWKPPLALPYSFLKLSAPAISQTFSAQALSFQARLIGRTRSWWGRLCQNYSFHIPKYLYFWAWPKQASLNDVEGRFGGGGVAAAWHHGASPKVQFKPKISQERLVGSKWDLHHSTQRRKLYGPWSFDCWV